jgi:Holliday junction resolvase RusA-like endonuclease
MMALTMDRRIVTFDVVGIAQPKGSTRAFVPKSWAQQAAAAGTAPRAIVTSDNPTAKDWQRLVADQAQTVAADGQFVGAVMVAIVFRLPRPASLPRKVRHHLRKPDVDKLARCCLDALRGVLYPDDSRVVALTARKVYTPDGQAPSACITVADADDPEPAAVGLFADGPC